MAEQTLGLRRWKQAKRRLKLREARAYCRQVVVSLAVDHLTLCVSVQAEFRSRHPPAFDCPSCRAPFALFTDWWRHVNHDLSCTFETTVVHAVEVAPNPLAGNCSPRIVPFITKDILAELTRHLDEFVALEHAAFNAALLSQHLRKSNPVTKKEFMTFVSVLRERIGLNKSAKKHLSTRRRRLLRCSRRDNCSSFELEDLKNCFIILDVEKRGGLIELELRILFVALVEEWQSIPCAGSKRAKEADQLACSAAASIIKYTGTDVVSVVQFLDWWDSDRANDVRFMLVPVSSDALGINC